MRLYECGVRYEKIMPNGAQKRITELYLVDALSFTEAESVIIRELTPYLSGDFDVISIKRTNYSEIVRDTDNIPDKWFKAKVNFLSIDEKTGGEKKNATYLIVNTGSINAAHNALVSHLKNTISDYEIATLDETKIIDLFQYQPDTNDDN